MHEYSIVNSLLELCEQHARENEAKNVLKVSLSIGVLSGVEPELLRSAFETFKEGTICEHSKLDMVVEPITARCLACQKEFEVVDFHYVCPHCQSVDLQTLTGQEMHLMSLEME